MAVARVVWEAASVLNLLGGLALLLLGIYVLVVRPRRAGNLALAAFTLGLGLRYSLGNLVGPFNSIVQLTTDDPLLPALAAIRVLGLALAGAGLAAIALVVPRPHAPSRWVVAPAAIAAAQLLGATAVWFAAGIGPAFAASGTPAIDEMPDGVARSLFVAENLLRWVVLPAAATGAVALMVARRARSTDERERHSLLLVALSIAVIAGVEAGSVAGPPVYNDALGVLAIAGLLSAAGLALLDALRSAHEARRGSLVLMVAIPAATFAGMVIPSGVGGAAGAPGVSRAIAGGILAYAILRAQLLGIDVRVRWGIQRSTLAAIFVVVFFVASEVAQQWFGARNAYVGILAAGALLFALAPLQRFAEKVANAAVPDAAAKPMAATDRAWAYAEAARAAWKDGSLSRDERAMLDRLRDALAIPEEDAHRIEREAAKEAG